MTPEYSRTHKFRYIYYQSHPFLFHSINGLMEVNRTKKKKKKKTESIEVKFTTPRYSHLCGETNTQIDRVSEREKRKKSSLMLLSYQMLLFFVFLKKFLCIFHSCFILCVCVSSFEWFTRWMWMDGIFSYFDLIRLVIK